MNKRLALLLSTTLILGFGSYAMAGEDTAPVVKLDALNLTQTPLNGATNTSGELPDINDFGTNPIAGAEVGTSITKETIPTMEKPQPPIPIRAIEYNPDLYKNPNFGHAKKSYNEGNYTGAAQELFAYLQKNPESAEAFYYLAMTLAALGDTNGAVQAYEKSITLTDDEGFRQIASKGRDCLIGGPLCAAVAEVLQTADPDPLDEFINAPFEEDGFSPELKEQMKLKQLESIKNNINRKETLDPDEVQEIKEFDDEYSGAPDKKSYGEEISGEKLALADVSNEDIVSAINTLRDAGMTVTIQPTVQTNFQNPQMAEMSMMLGSGQNSNNNDPMTQMLPYMMQASTSEGAQNINPQVVQAMMMSSMMNNLDFNSYDNK